MTSYIGHGYRRACLMQIAVATKHNWTEVSGHAGQTHDWLVFDNTTTLCKLRDLFSRH